MEVCMWPQSSRQLLINFCYVLFSVTSCLTGLKVMWRALWSLAAWPPSSLLTTVKSSYEDGDWQHPWFRLGTFTSRRWGQRSHRVISAFFLSGLSGTIWSRLIHTHHHWGMKLFRRSNPLWPCLIHGLCVCTVSATLLQTLPDSKQGETASMSLQKSTYYFL